MVHDVGFRDALDLFNSATRLAVSEQAHHGNPARQAVNTWVDSGSLQEIAWSDLFSTVPKGWATRTDAMRVPGVAKARALILGLISARPLVALNRQGILSPEAQPTWLYRTDTPISPQFRTMCMLDDLIFYDATMLTVRRGTPQYDGDPGQILDAVHLPRDRWSVTDDGVILVDDDEAPEHSVIWIPGPWAGLLREAGETIRGARDITRAWTQRVRTPLPGIIIQETEPTGLKDEEIDVLLAKIANARRSEDGAVMFLPQGLTATPISANDDAALFENGRNAARLDIANFLNIPAGLLDGSPNSASLTYDTRISQRNDLQDYSLNWWTLPLESRLSLDDVVPRGTRVRFDWSDLDAPTNSPTGAAEGD